MVRWYPDDLIRRLVRYRPEQVHSLVLFTKFPAAVLADPLRAVLARYDQVVVHITITGLGGTRLEPRVPPPEETLAALPGLVDFVGSPERVVVRIDPIVHWREAAEPRHGSEVRSNSPSFAGIAGQAVAAGVRGLKTSLASPYAKAIRRFQAAGLELVTLEGAPRERVLATLEREAAAAGAGLQFCCEATRPMTACVDAALLSRLHPRGLPARPDRAGGQRVHCGCTQATDLAWYSTHPCPSGCLYCYANPTRDRRQSQDAPALGED